MYIVIVLLLMLVFPVLSVVHEQYFLGSLVQDVGEPNTTRSADYPITLFPFPRNHGLDLLTRRGLRGRGCIR